MDISLFGWLAGPDGRALLARLAAADLRESNTLALLTDLRRDLPPDVAGAALTLARLLLSAMVWALVACGFSALWPNKAFVFVAVFAASVLLDALVGALFGQ